MLEIYYILANVPGPARAFFRVWHLSYANSRGELNITYEYHPWCSNRCPADRVRCWKSRGGKNLTAEHARGFRGLFFYTRAFPRALAYFRGPSRVSAGEIPRRNARREKFNRGTYVQVPRFIFLQACISAGPSVFLRALARFRG